MKPRIKILLEIPVEAIDRDGEPFTAVESIIFNSENIHDTPKGKRAEVSFYLSGRSGIAKALGPNYLGGYGSLRIDLPLSDEQYNAIDCEELT